MLEETKTDEEKREKELKSLLFKKKVTAIILMVLGWGAFIVAMITIWIPFAPPFAFFTLWFLLFFLGLTMMINISKFLKAKKKEEENKEK